LLAANVGFSALIAVLIWRAFEGPGFTRRAGASLLAAVHVLLPPFFAVYNATSTVHVARATENVALTAEIGPNRPRVFVIGTSDSVVDLYAAHYLAASAPETMACWSTLSASKQAHWLSRTGPSDLQLRTESGPMLGEGWAPLYRADVRSRVGDEVRQCGATFRVVEAVDGRPTAVNVHFDRALEDPSVALLVWREGRLRALRLPSVGEPIRIPWSSGPGFL
jgi:hypothetical protein